MDWIIKEQGFDSARIAAMENRFLCGNGYLGIRGSLEEYTKENMPAINLAGLYDQVGDGWREPLNAPNGLYTSLTVDGKVCALPAAECTHHELKLDFRRGVFHRETSWKTPRGMVTVKSERFASRENVHLIAMRYTVSANFHAEIELRTGIDGDVWDIHGPHYDRLRQKSVGDVQIMTAVTHEKQDKVTVLERACVSGPAEERPESTYYRQMRVISFVTDAEHPCTLEKCVLICTSADPDWTEESAVSELRAYSERGYDSLLQAHAEAWEEKWQHAEVEIEGDEEACLALNYSLYHLLSIAPTHAEGLSIPARGLSGQTYKGAVFWDTEMFMLDFFLFTDPSVARTLMKYRVDTLDGALKKAASYGHIGAFYAWESQEGGYDACTDYNVTDVFTGRPQRTYFRDKQYHISAAVTYGIMRYTEITGDTSLLADGGWRVVVECARFYYDILVKRVNGSAYEIHDVIGPDEYHERVNNNAYTNRMAKFTIDAAVQVIRDGGPWDQALREEYNADELLRQLADASEHLYIPEPAEDGVIPQFDGYEKLEDASLSTVRSRLLHEKEYWGGAYGVATETKVIKQADVVTMLNLFSSDYDRTTLDTNWKYYEPRTEHGSSLSSCMYAMLACKCGRPEDAYPFFLKSARADLDDGGKEWAGLVYIGGTHPAAEGGAYMTAIEGFAGLHVEGDQLVTRAALPEKWKSMKFKAQFRGKEYEICVE